MPSAIPIKSGPSARVKLFSVFIHGALECHEANSDGKREHYIGNKNAGKEKEANEVAKASPA